MPTKKKKRSRRRLLKAGPRKGLLPRRQHKSITQHIFQVAVILIALYVYKKYYSGSYSINCEDPLNPLCPDKYFSDNYTDARNKFITISSTIRNAQLYHLPVYQLNENDYLYIDVTIINSNSLSSHLVAHVSGTHGIEGYAGSSIQYGLLEYISNITNHQKTHKLFDNFTLIDINDPNPPIIIFIHSLNPFGFHFSRRFNENNVDLNRNYKTKQEWNELLNYDQNNIKTNYDKLDGLFNPKYNAEYVIEQSNKLASFSRFISEMWCKYYYYASFLLNSGYYYVTVGKTMISRAFVTGQWYNKKGIEYNGEPFKLEESHQIIRDFLENTLFTELHPEWKQQIHKISAIDVHTGLGKYGVDTLLVEGEINYNKLKNIMPNHYKKDLILEGTQLLNDAYQYVNGHGIQHIHRIQQLLDSNDVDELAICQEFGTVGSLSVFNGLIYENGFTNAYNDYMENKDRNKEIEQEMKYLLSVSRKRLKDVFYCEYVEWKTEILKRGFNLFAQAFNR